MAFVDNALPTLLTSRAQTVRDEAPKRRFRPAPASLEIPEEPSAEIVAKHAALRIRNTFIEGSVPPSPSMEAFLRERFVQTCPSKHAGRITSLMEEIASGSAEALPVTPFGIQTPCNIETPLAVGVPNSYGAQSWSSLLLPPYQNSVRPSAHNMVHAPLVPPDSLRAVPMPPAGEASVQVVEGAGGFRAVLSLVDALVPEALAWPAAMPEARLFSSAPPPQLMPILPAAVGFEARSETCTAPEYIPNICLDSDASGIPPPPLGPAPGSEELPSMGSAEHVIGTCKPCAFFFTKGCENGLTCRFCHLCGPEERRRRQKDKIQQLKEERRQRKERQRLRAASA
eukprot:CAMPEP_0177204000 /NCGR_PEP_ID=MMETSP0367-20130122/28112_1 /TAXON_ID=447022 ORGANISM="Scrippsiella hangoei-like, Strain SHHI-4" /NCGR_SAMPLE_ID=MMETSP0367 /ASSEMBLY_ACC=CAM_ASM_000362 /LENGTH=340 /DNA_ID=CAMNT_0018652663 /DNA_START=61 /DNA_END=1083 /DNA_ORIENTATION=-